MASLADIPDELLASEDIPAFIDWLESFPTSKSVRRSLISQWQKTTGRPLTKGQFDQVMQSAIDSNGAQE